MKNKLIYTTSNVCGLGGRVAATRYIQDRPQAIKLMAEILDVAPSAITADAVSQVRQDHKTYGHWRGLIYGETTHAGGNRSQVVIQTPRYRWAEALVWLDLAPALVDDRGVIDWRKLREELHNWRKHDPAMYYEPDPYDENPTSWETDDMQHALMHEEISEAMWVAVAAVAASMCVL